MKSTAVSAIPPWFSFRCPQCYTRLTRLPVSRTFITTARKRAIAAPEIEFSDDTPSPNIENARIVPGSPSYFTGRPRFTDNVLLLQELLGRYARLPTVSQAHAPRVAWRNIAQYRLMVGEPVPESRYLRVIAILKRLNRILPSMTPPGLKSLMQIYMLDTSPWDNVPTPGEIDASGRAYGIGRRKSSTAKVYLVQGEGEVRVNGKSINSAFARIHDRESALWALKATGRMDKYNIWALASGGGTTGQAEAITLGVAKALLVHEPDLKPALRRAGCVTRNPKRVERKKPGRLKARKMPAWVKG
ncbi:37S ribosomal protein S9, mitochondrial [Pseudocyphellaria aurata]|nr:37S ribosomal protein S9, mitochondrial [Pseudocyphellaria aurata]